MKNRSSAFMVALVLLGASNACSRGGSSSGSGGASATSGGDGSGGQTEPGAGRPSSEPEAGSVGDSQAGAPSENPVDGGGPSTDAGASSGGQSGAPTDATHPDYPFDLGAAVAATGQSLDPKREVLDAQTVEYTLSGSSLVVTLDHTEWSTAAEAEFECSRSKGALIVGPDRMLFVANDSVWLSASTACTQVRVTSNGQYSPTLTRSFAQSVLGSP